MLPPALPHSGPHAPFSPLHVPVEAAHPLHPASKRLFLDVFAGRLHAVTSAAIGLGLDCFEPFDLEGDTAHDILDNEVFEALLRLCWSGIVALIMLAPPCKEYSRLKLRAGRPKNAAVHGRGPVQSSGLQRRRRHLGTAAISWKRPTSTCYVITSVPWCG